MSGMEDFNEGEDYQFDGVLDLTGADESAGSFEAFRAGQYNAHVAKAEWKTTKPEGGKLPGNTPYLNIHFAIDDETDADGMKIKNRRVFHKVFIAPEGHEKIAYHRGVMLNTLLALGYTREEISKKGFRVDTEEMGGREAVVHVSKDFNKHTNVWDNNVKSVKPAGSAAASATAGALV
jgi:Protein of unknown function (DUF669)